MPYDRTWARKVYEAYAKLHTRAQQINMCLQQLIVLSDGSHPLIAELVTILIDSIQRKSHKGLWEDYKRLVKRTPLDNKLLYKLATRLSANVTDDYRQPELFSSVRETT